MLSQSKKSAWFGARLCLGALVFSVIGLYMMSYMLPKDKTTAVLFHRVMSYLQTSQTKNSQKNLLFLQNNGSKETFVECVGPFYNQSCLYRNLYYVNRTFLVLTVKGRNLPNLTIRSHWRPPADLTPSKIEFNSSVQLESFVRDVTLTEISNLTVYFYQLWSFNIAHALFDGLYPAFISFLRFAPTHLHPFRLLNGFYGCKDCWVAMVCSRFAGLGILDLDDLNKMSIGRWIVFEKIIMGSGNMCQRCLTEKLQLPGGIELDGSRLFRDRMYEKHGVCPPITLQKHSAENRNYRNVLMAYVVDNKRFTDTDRKELKAAIDEVNKQTDKYLNESIDRLIKMRLPLIRVSYLDYAHLPDTTNSSVLCNKSQIMYPHDTNKPAESKFTLQLGLLRKMDIHITGPGTGQFYQTFLSHGAVTINLGGVAMMTEGNRTIKYTTFMEQYVTGGTPYIRGLFYPINERTKGIKKEHIIQLIEKAAQLIMDGFSIPVASKENLAKDGQLFTELCEKDKDFCTSFTVRKIRQEFRCMDSWPELVVHEDDVWRVGGIVENGRKVTCPLNRTILHELRAKYGIDH